MARLRPLVLLLNIGDDNFYVDESNGSAEVTIDDRGDTAHITATVEAVPLIDPLADGLEYSIDLECLEVGRY